MVASAAVGGDDANRKHNHHAHRSFAGAAYWMIITCWVFMTMASTPTIALLLGQMSKRSCDESCQSTFGLSMEEAFTCSLGCSAGDRLLPISLGGTSGQVCSNCSDYCVTDNELGFSTWDSTTQTYQWSGSSVGYALNYYVANMAITTEMAILTCMSGCQERGLCRQPLILLTCDQLCGTDAILYGWTSGDIIACQLGCACGDSLSIPANSTCPEWCSTDSVADEWSLYDTNDLLIANPYDMNGDGLVNLVNATSPISACQLGCDSRAICITPTGDSSPNQ
jgi:hypothetical protein